MLAPVPLIPKSSVPKSSVPNPFYLGQDMLVSVPRPCIHVPNPSPETGHASALILSPASLILYLIQDMLASVPRP
jgi:hypothetical protein